MSDLPDYTKYVTPNVEVPEVSRPFGTKAETVAHVSGYDRDTGGAAGITLDAAPAGQKAGLIMVIATTEAALSELTLYTKQSAAWTKVWDRLFVDPDGPLVLLFPCWVPTQDVGDGSTQNVRLEFTAGCSDILSLYALYYFE